MMPYPALPCLLSMQGREPLLYVTVLLLSLQLPAALRFLWQVGYF
jgi:hypothetical protein